MTIFRGIAATVLLLGLSVVSLLIAPSALASVGILGMSASGTANDGAASSIPISSFTVGSGNDRLLVVSTGAAGNIGADVTGVTFGGTSLTQAIDQDGEFGATAEIWSLKLGSSASPTTANVVVTYDRAVFAYAVAAAFQGVDQGATPVNATGNTAPSITVTSQSGNFVLDAITQSATDDGSITVGAGQTQEGNFNLGFGGEFDGGVSTEPGAASVDMSWTSTGSSTVFAHAAININQAASSDAVVNAGGGNNSIIVREDSSGNIEVVVDGTTVFDIPRSSLTSLTINGEGGDDTLTTDYAFAGGFFDLPITFNGGTGVTDRLAVRGNGTTNAVYTPDTALTGNGVVAVDGTAITFTGLEPVDISGMMTATLSLPGADDLLTLDNGFDFATGTTPAIQVSGTSGGVAIEEAAFFNNTHVVIDTTATDGNDTITVTSADNAHNNTNLTINTGAGTDAVNLNGRMIVTGTVTITTSGPIADGNGPADNIVATSTALSGDTGVGTSADPLDTRVSNLEAEAVTGGIFISNSGSVSIGGVSSTLRGLLVQTSGDLQLVNTGAITLIDQDGLETIKGGDTSGNVMLSALGATADVTSTVDEDAISAARGSITVTAGRDILMGTAGNFDNDVRADGAILLSAGRDVVVDGRADVSSDDSGQNTGGSLHVVAGRNISVLNTPDARLAAGGSAGADVVLTTGAAGVLTLTATDPAAVLSQSGDVTVNANQVAISNTSGISAASGIVTLQPLTAGTDIDLGSETGGELSLTDAELDRIAATILRIGNTNSGNIALTSQITAPAGYSTLELRTGGAIIDGTGGEQADITVANLALQAGTGIGSADDLDMAVSTIAFNNTGGAVNISNTGALTINPVAGLTTSSNTGTTTTIATTSPLTFAADTSSVGDAVYTAGETSDFPACADDLTVNSGVTVGVTAGNLTLRAGDDIVLQPGSTVTASGTVTKQPSFMDTDNCGLDFGDAPTSAQSGFASGYPTLLAAGGARHSVTPGFTLGATIDFEADGQPNATATGDDLAGFDDEDGVTFLSPVVANSTAEVRVNVQGAPPAGARLDAWIDWNRDGDWTDADEQVAVSTTVMNGDNTLIILVPASAEVAAVRTTFARFRLSTAGGLAPTGAALDGEVEDYALTLAPRNVSINDVSEFEGNFGTTSITFTVTLSSPSSQTVTVDFSTADGTATTANNDYQSTAGAVIFAPGQTTKPVTVNVNGDTDVEPDEDFFVNLSNPQNATIADGQGRGAILNDDLSSDASCTITGTNKDDFIEGTPGDDVICGGSGNDTIDGKGGNDIILGENGQDLLVGGDGNDLLLGGNGNDALHGGNGNDTLHGESGDDTLEGGAGSDALYGENGSDSLNSQDGVSGNDSADGGKANDTCLIDPGDQTANCP